MRTLPELAEGNLLLDAMRRLLEGDLEIIAQVRAPAGAATVALAAEKLVENPAAPTTLLAEDLAEDVERIVEAATSAAEAAGATRTAALLERGMAVTVVGGAFLRILQHLVGLGDLLEHLLRLLVARILVRVKLHGLLAIGLLQFLLVGPLGHAEQLVVILLLSRGHGQAFVSLAGPLDTIAEAGRSRRPLSV